MVTANELYNAVDKALNEKFRSCGCSFAHVYVDAALIVRDVYNNLKKTDKDVTARER